MAELRFLILPENNEKGDVFISGIQGEMWKINILPGSRVVFGNLKTIQSPDAYLASTDNYDYAELIYVGIIDSIKTWIVRISIGNILVHGLTEEAVSTPAKFEIIKNKLSGFSTYIIGLLISIWILSGIIFIYHLIF